MYPSSFSLSPLGIILFTRRCNVGTNINTACIGLRRRDHLQHSSLPGFIHIIKKLVFIVVVLFFIRQWQCSTSSNADVVVVGIHDLFVMMNDYIWLMDKSSCWMVCLHCWLNASSANTFCRTNFGSCSKTR